MGILSKFAPAMEIFYSKDIDGNLCRLGVEESGHCLRVLRYRRGDEIFVIDGEGCLMRCRLVDDSQKGAVAEIVEMTKDWGGHPYRLHLAVCPTKNMDRYEWFAEKACEVGVDVITPIIGEHSERRVFKGNRVEKILISAAKQSLKGRVPELAEMVRVKDFVRHNGAPAGEGGAEGASAAASGMLRLIAYCFEDNERPRISIREALEASDARDITVMIGPEGDFSREEATLAVEYGFIPVHLGVSRLRTETAALTAAEAVYFHFL